MTSSCMKEKKASAGINEKVKVYLHSLVGASHLQLSRKCQAENFCSDPGFLNESNTFYGGRERQKRETSVAVEIDLSANGNRN